MFRRLFGRLAALAVFLLAASGRAETKTVAAQWDVTMRPGLDIELKGEDWRVVDDYSGGVFLQTEEGSYHVLNIWFSAELRSGLKGGMTYPALSAVERGRIRLDRVMDEVPPDGFDLTVHVDIQYDVPDAVAGTRVTGWVSNSTPYEVAIQYRPGGKGGEEPMALAAHTAQAADGTIRLGSEMGMDRNFTFAERGGNVQILLQGNAWPKIKVIVDWQLPVAIRQRVQNDMKLNGKTFSDGWEYTKFIDLKEEDFGKDRDSLVRLTIGKDPEDYEMTHVWDSPSIRTNLGEITRCTVTIRQRGGRAPPVEQPRTAVVVNSTPYAMEIGGMRLAEYGSVTIPAPSQGTPAIAGTDADAFNVKRDGAGWRVELKPDAWPRINIRVERETGTQRAKLACFVRGEQVAAIPATVVLGENDFRKQPDELVSVRAEGDGYTVQGQWSPTTLQTGPRGVTTYTVKVGKKAEEPKREMAENTTPYTVQIGGTVIPAHGRAEIEVPVRGRPEVSGEYADAFSINPGWTGWRVELKPGAWPQIKLQVVRNAGAQRAGLVWSVRGGEAKTMPTSIVLNESDFGKRPDELVSVRSADDAYMVRGEWSPSSLQTVPGGVTTYTVTVEKKPEEAKWVVVDNTTPYEVTIGNTQISPHKIDVVMAPARGAPGISGPHADAFDVKAAGEGWRVELKSGARPRINIRVMGVKDAELVWKVRGKEQRILPAPIVIEEHEFGRLPSELLSVRAADADYSVRGEWSPPTLQTGPWALTTYTVTVEKKPEGPKPAVVENTTPYAVDIAGITIPAHGRGDIVVPARGYPEISGMYADAFAVKQEGAGWRVEMKPGTWPRVELRVNVALGADKAPLEWSWQGASEGKLRDYVKSILLDEHDFGKRPGDLLSVWSTSDEYIVTGEWSSQTLRTGPREVTTYTVTVEKKPEKTVRIRNDSDIPIRWGMTSVPARDSVPMTESEAARLQNETPRPGGGVDAASYDCSWERRWDGDYVLNAVQKIRTGRMIVRNIGPVPVLAKWTQGGRTDSLWLRPGAIETPDLPIGGTLSFAPDLSNTAATNLWTGGSMSIPQGGDIVLEAQPRNNKISRRVDDIRQIDELPYSPNPQGETASLDEKGFREGLEALRESGLEPYEVPGLPDYDDLMDKMDRWKIRFSDWERLLRELRGHSGWRSYMALPRGDAG